jgi:hypothetical protein
MCGMHIGTSAFTAAGWEGSFYPRGMQPSDFLTYYATKFNTVEVDSTFYRAPSASTVEGWRRKTPDNLRRAYASTPGGDHVAARPGLRLLERHKSTLVPFTRKTCRSVLLFDGEGWRESANTTLNLGPRACLAGNIVLATVGVFPGNRAANNHSKDQNEG